MANCSRTSTVSVWPPRKHSAILFGVTARVFCGSGACTVWHTGEDVSPSPGKGYQGGLAGQTFFEAMRAFLLQHFLADADMAAEMQAARGAAHYDMEQYTVRGGHSCCAQLPSGVCQEVACWPAAYSTRLCCHISCASEILSMYLDEQQQGITTQCGRTQQCPCCCCCLWDLQLQHELGQLVLKRFLLLVLLLDKAATHLAAALRTPLLFKLTASIKSSRQVRQRLRRMTPSLLSNCDC